MTDLPTRRNDDRHDRLIRGLEDYVRRELGLSDGATILLAVSGGRDSIVMADAMSRMASSRGWRLCVGHVDHGLREESADDAAWVRDWCERAGLPFAMRALDPAALHSSPEGLEAAARRARYDALEQMADEAATECIATAHHLDDQAETVLYRALRGSGTRGLAGIRPRAGRLIRPLLWASRSLIDNYAKERALDFRDDASNADAAMVRNALRHRVLPVLEDIVPGHKPSLARLAEAARMDGEALEELARMDRRAAAKNLGDASGAQGGLELDRVVVQSLSAARRSNLWRHLLSDLPGVVVARSTVQRLEELLFTDRPSAQTPLGGTWTAMREYDRLLIRPESATAKGDPPPRVVHWPDRIECEPWGRLEIYRTHAEAAPEPSAQCAWLRESSLVGSVIVRTPQAGDAYEPVGFPGRRKLSDLFIDAKLPRALRSRVPILADEKGIVWTVGFPPARRAAQGRDASSALVARLVRDSAGV